MDGHRRIGRGTRVTLTGASGFVGSHLARQLVAAGACVRATVRPKSHRHLVPEGVKTVIADLSDPAALSRAFDGAEFVFHTAAAVGFHENWDYFRQANVIGTSHVIVAARSAGVKRLVHTSSIVAVGASSTPTALDESAAWNLDSMRAPYVTTKREAELTALAASDSRLQVVVVNPGCVVGPDDWSNSEFGTFCRRYWCGRIPFCFGGGNNFVDVRDVAAGMIAAAERGRGGERYLLVGENRTYREFCAELGQAAGTRRLCFRLPNVVARVGASITALWARQSSRRPYLTPSQSRLLGWYFFFDGSKAQCELGIHPRPLRETLAETHEFWMGQAA